MAARLPPRPFLYPVVDVGLLGERPLGAVIRTLTQGGVCLLQLRAKGLTDRLFLALATEALTAAHAAGSLLIVNDRPDVASMIGADGVHLGQDDLAPADARAILGPEAIIGLSTHTRKQLEAAEDEPVDYVAVGPVFATITKANPDPVVGLELVREARKLTSRPLVAIGGITRRNAAAVVEAGADGVAVISDLLRAPDLEAALSLLHSVIRASA